MTHSVADAVAFAITTPAGVILHTGDFKIDYTPLQGEPIDLQRFAEIGRNGVLLLMADSTNAQRRGYTPSEQTVAATLEGIFCSGKKQNHSCDVRFKRRQNTADHRSRGEIQEKSSDLRPKHGQYRRNRITAGIFAYPG